jgi:hypothetical protein
MGEVEAFLHSNGIEYVKKMHDKSTWLGVEYEMKQEFQYEAGCYIYKVIIRPSYYHRDELREIGLKSREEYTLVHTLTYLHGESFSSSIAPFILKHEEQGKVILSKEFKEEINQLMANKSTINQ